MNFKLTLALLLMFGVMITPSYAQVQQFEVRNPEVIPAIYMGLTPELRHITPDPNYVPIQTRSTNDDYNPRDNWQNHPWLDESVLPQIDPVWQQEYTTGGTARSAILANFEGQDANGVNPPDPTMDVGPNHVIAMINHPSGSSFVVYDKNGNPLTGELLLSTLTNVTGAGDPIIIYDQLADRWMLSEFADSGNFLVIAVSQTPDPLGAWHMYSFMTPSFPDYPKYAIWPDAYYVTSNENNQAVYAIDRVNLLAGNPATMQRFELPDFPTIGFQAATPVNLSGPTLPGVNQPGIIMRIADDAWSANVPTDRLEMYDFVVDFDDMNNSALTGPFVLETESFDTELCGYTSFSCFPQPDNGANLDPLREVLMNKVYYRNFGTHESIVASHVTDVDATDHGGVRWYELRRVDDGDWSIYQQGTYAPDGDSRWMSAIGINADGSIGLAYNVASTSTYSSLRHTGRLSCDPLGTMTIAETEIATGGGANGSFRYGDYSSMSVDETTGAFWFTGEYNPTTSWSTRIAAFDIPFACTAPVCSSIPSMPTDAATNVDISLCETIGLSLSWSATDFASSYDVYLGTTSGALTLLGTTTSTSFDVPSAQLAYNTTYFWQIVAKNGAGMSTCSEWSFTTEASEGIPPCSDTATNPVDGATDVSIDPVNGLTLSWEAVCQANEYDVYGGLTSGALTFLGTVIGTAINISNTDAPAGMTYYWQVIPVNAAGNAVGCTEWSFTTAPEDNDNCITPQLITCENSPVAGSTIDSTVDSEYINCGAGGDNTTQRGIWYQYEGDNQQVTMTTCDPDGVGYDTRLTVFTGTCNALECVVANDDMIPACPGSSFRSEVQFNANVGTTYYIYVHGYQTGTGLSAVGDFNLYITCEELCLPVPSNEDCASAISLTTTTDLTCSTVSGDNSCAAAPIDNPSCFSDFATLPDVWYSFEADFASQFINITLGTATGMGYAIYDACEGTQIDCDSGVTSGEDNEITGLTPGNTYYVQVLGSIGDAGSFDICITGGGPPNDACGDAIDVIAQINGGDVLGATINANNADAPVDDCAGAATPDNGVWYFFFYSNLPNNLEFTVDDGVALFIYTGSCGDLTCVPDAVGQGTNSVSFEANDGAPALSGGGQFYYLYVSDDAGQTFTINMSNNSLPIELSHFSGQADEKVNVLEWTTSAEINSALFVVERSLTGRDNWSKVGEVAAAGHSTTTLNYSLLDEEPLEKAYYRLKSINENGSFQFSNTIIIERKVESTIAVYPVPATESVKVEYSSTKEESTTLTVTDVAGRVVHQATLLTTRGLNETNIAINRLASGIYFITLDNNEIRVTTKMVKE